MNTKNFDPYDFSKREINGVPVYYKNLPWAPCIHVRVVFNNGAFDDPIGKEGLSHFLEHMIFDGSPTLPDKKAIKEWKKLHTLNTWNAWTNFDNTCYWFKCLPEEYNTALTGLKDMVFNPYLRTEDTEHERKIITQEAWGRFHNEKFLAYSKECLNNLYYGHNHERLNSALGWPDTIAKISQEDIKAWHTKNYGIGNFFIVLTGALEEKHIEKLNDFLSNIPKIIKTQYEVGTLGKPKQNRFTRSADEIGEIKEQVEVTILRVAGKRPYQENEIGSLFSRLISDLLNERLRTELGLCYGVDAGLARRKTYSQMYMSVKTDEKNIALVEKEFKSIIDEIISNKFIDRFNIIKKLYLDQLKSLEMFSGDIADDAIEDLVCINNKIITEAEQIIEVEKVRYEDVVKIVKWAFDPEYLFTEIILPSKKQ